MVFLHGAFYFQAGDCLSHYHSGITIGDPALLPLPFYSRHGPGTCPDFPLHSRNEDIIFNEILLILLRLWERSVTQILGLITIHKPQIHSAISYYAHFLPGSQPASRWEGSVHYLHQPGYFMRLYTSQSWPILLPAQREYWKTFPSSQSKKGEFYNTPTLGPRPSLHLEYVIADHSFSKEIPSIP